jgi:hypothetical protein
MAPQTLTAIEKKKNLTSRARVRVTCAREKLRYGMNSEVAFMHKKHGAIFKSRLSPSSRRNTD